MKQKYEVNKNEAKNILKQNLIMKLRNEAKAQIKEK